MIHLPAIEFHYAAPKSFQACSAKLLAGNTECYIHYHSLP